MGVDGGPAGDQGAVDLAHPPQVEHAHAARDWMFAHGVHSCCTLLEVVIPVALGPTVHYVLRAMMAAVADVIGLCFKDPKRRAVARSRLRAVLFPGRGLK
jgi:hypothetical protein